MLLGPLSLWCCSIQPFLCFIRRTCLLSGVRNWGQSLLRCEGWCVDLLTVMFLLWIWMPLCLVHKYLELQYPLEFFYWLWLCLSIISALFWFEFYLSDIKIATFAFFFVHFLEIPFSILLPEVVSILEVMVCFLCTTNGLILFSNPVSMSFYLGIGPLIWIVINE